MFEKIKSLFPYKNKDLDLPAFEVKRHKPRTVKIKMSDLKKVQSDGWYLAGMFKDIPAALVKEFGFPQFFELNKHACYKGLDEYFIDEVRFIFGLEIPEVCEEIFRENGQKPNPIAVAALLGWQMLYADKPKSYFKRTIRGTAT